LLFSAYVTIDDRLLIKMYQFTVAAEIIDERNGSRQT